MDLSIHQKEMCEFSSWGRNYFLKLYPYASTFSSKSLESFSKYACLQAWLMYVILQDIFPLHIDLIKNKNKMPQAKSGGQQHCFMSGYTRMVYYHYPHLFTAP